MTGLDTERESIIEIATVVTDGELNVLAEGPVLAIHQTPEVLGQMDEWNTRQHDKSGLIERVRLSQITAAEGERQPARGRPGGSAPGWWCVARICTGA